MKLLRAKLAALTLLFTAFQASSQMRLPVSPGLRSDLQKVVTDFPKNFPNLIGDVVAENAQSTDYACNLKFSGAEENSITRYSGNKPVYSWQAVMLTTEDFQEATKKYKWLCSQVKGMTMQLSDVTFTLTGDIDPADESKKFSSSVFKLMPAAVNLPKMKVEVSIQFYFPEWKVGLAVYDREREDNEQGSQDDSR